MSSRPTNPRTSKPLPPPTRSETAFERALASLRDAREPAHRVAVADDAGAFVSDAFARRDEFLEREPFAGIADAASFYTKIVGVSFEGRQDVIAGLREGTELQLLRQPENPKDPNAIAMYDGNLQIGFVRALIAKHLAPHMDGGVRYRARIASLTGGAATPSQAGGRHRGVNVYVWRIDPNVASPAQRQAARDAWNGDARRVREALIGQYPPHAAQEEVLARIAAGKNTLAVLGTGRGKSFCFQYPAVLRALEHGHKTLAIYPLRALANDQYESLKRKLDPFGLRILRANGSIAPEEREELFEALRDGTWDVALATPEFLEYHRDAFGARSLPSLVVVDEAHHLFESKHRAAYGKLGRTIAGLGDCQIVALTATADDDAFAHVVRELRIDAWVIDPTVRENLTVVDARNTKDKFGYLGDLCTPDDGKTIVYCMSRPEAQKAADALRKRLGDVVMFYHAGMPTADRLGVEAFFRSGALRVVVATSAFGEGIDLPDVRNVVLYHLNFDFTSFNQQAGRAGRDGRPSEIHLLFGDADRRINEFIIDRAAPTLPVLRELYRGIRGLADEGTVRMAHTDIARTLDLDKADERTVGAALRIFEDAGLVEVGTDDDGRYVRFLRVDGKVDLTQNERYAEGEAERESFSRFADFALTARPEALERIINRPIYPQRAELLRG
ncbi:MAG TPA: DEAD/DEAH box helicase [Candidatus Baltobacteraceae bacterium]